MSSRDVTVSARVPIGTLITTMTIERFKGLVDLSQFANPQIVSMRIVHSVFQIPEGIEVLVEAVVRVDDRILVDEGVISSACIRMVGAERVYDITVSVPGKNPWVIRDVPEIQARLLAPCNGDIVGRTAFVKYGEVSGEFISLSNYNGHEVWPVN